MRRLAVSCALLLIVSCAGRSVEDRGDPLRSDNTPGATAAVDGAAVAPSAAASRLAVPSGGGGRQAASGGFGSDGHGGGCALDGEVCGPVVAPACADGYPEGCWVFRPDVLDVPLLVTETDGVGRSPVALTSGIPIPRTLHLVDPSGLRVLDPDGDPVPAAFTPLARWGASPADTTAPVRWLLMDVLTSVGPHEGLVLRLVDGGGPSPVLPPLGVTADAGVIRVDTGVATLQIDESEGTIRLDGLSGPLMLTARGPDGTLYRSTGPVTAEVTAASSLRAGVTVHGTLRDGDGSGLVDYTARFWLYAGLGDLRMLLSIENPEPCPIDEAGQIDCYDIGSAGSVDIDDATVTIPVAGRRFVAGGETADHTGSLAEGVVVYQDSSGTAAWDTYRSLRDWDGSPVDGSPRMQSAVRFRGYRTTLGGRVIDAGDHAPGSMAVEGPDGWWGVLVPRFWETFPKALRGSDGGIEIGLFPGEYGPEGFAFTLRAGEQVTTEVILTRGRAAQQMGDPLLAVAPAAWYAGSRAAGPLAPAGDGWGRYEDYIAAQLDPAPGYVGEMDWYPDLPTAIERADFYGIFDYGDWPIDYEGLGVAPLNLKYDANAGAWLQWLRGGDARWAELALAANRHLADVDVLHTLHTPRHWSDGIVFGHSYHDEGGLTNPHRNYGGNHPDTMSGVSGLLLTHYLTGDEAAYAAALEIADAIEYRLRNDEHLCQWFPECTGEGYALGPGIWGDGERPAANALAIAVAASRATGDLRYLEVARALVEWGDAGRQPYIDGAPGGGGHVKPWMLGLWLRALADYIDLASEFGLDAEAATATTSYLRYVDFLADHVVIELEPGADGRRAALPYLWSFGGGAGNASPSVNNWLLLAADVFADAFRLSGSRDRLGTAARLFRAGSLDPWYEGDADTYSSTKETVNAISFGQVFLREWAER